MKENDENNIYGELYEMLTPRREIKASADLRRRIADTVDRREAVGRRSIWFQALIPAAAAAAVVVLLLIPTGMSAKELLTSALDAIRNERAVSVELDVRTAPADNFSYIDDGLPFVAHTLQAVHGDSTMIWHADKGWRQACGNGKECWVWLKGGIGWRLDDYDAQVLNYLSIFLTPQKIIEAELEAALLSDGSDYDITHGNGEINLTVRSSAQGDYANPYMLNRSVAGSNNVRRYTFDSKSRTLKRASVSIIRPDGSECEVIRLRSISFAPLDPTRLCNVPSDIPFIDETSSRPQIHGFAGATPTEVAKAVLGAFQSWNTDIIYKVMDSTVGEVLYRTTYQGAKLVSIGEPFTSGPNPQLRFVPYTLTMPDGSVKASTLALYLYDDGSWEVTGGI